MTSTIGWYWSTLHKRPQYCPFLEDLSTQKPVIDRAKRQEYISHNYTGGRLGCIEKLIRKQGACQLLQLRVARASCITRAATPRPISLYAGWFAIDQQHI